MHLYQQDLTKIKEILDILYQNVIFIECWVYDVTKKENQKIRNLALEDNVRTNRTEFSPISGYSNYLYSIYIPSFVFAMALFCFTLSNPWYSIKEP